MDDPQATNQAGWFARTYQYSATIPHAVTNVTPETGSPDTYSYDANGNMTCRVEGGVTFKQDYNAENRISAIHKMNGTCSAGTVTESWLYGYDGDGVRVTTAHYTGVTLESLTLYYMGGAYEVTGSAVKKYYSMAGQTIMRDSDGSLKYLLTDHLGSTSAVTDQNGTLLSQQRYLPFGEVRTDTTPPYITQTDFTYTGQRNLSGTGLMDYKARMYSVTLGRFIQPDSIIPDQSNPQSWNRYSYVTNRPVNFNDPTGHIQCDPEDQGCKSKKLSKAGEIRYRLEYYYDIDITGGWDETELLHLEESLNKTAKYLGGKDNLNKAIQASLTACKKCAGKDFLTIYNSPGKTICYGTSYNCYDPNKATITIADYTFSSTYQKGKNRPRELGLDSTGMGAQVSIVHEISHMLGEANPAALSVYKGYVADPKALSPNNGPEESRANAMAYYIVSGGNVIAPYKYQEHLDYARDVAFLWNSSP